MAARSEYADVGGLRLHRLEFEGGGAGTPLLIAPGLGAAAQEWEPVASALSGRRRVIVIDWPGQGGSEWAPRYGYELLHDELVALANALGLDYFSLLGHSMGGVVAYLFAARSPGRVERLVVVDAAPPLPEDAPAQLPPRDRHAGSFADLDAAFRAARGESPRLTEEVFRRSFEHRYRRDAEGRWVPVHDPALGHDILREQREAARAWDEVLREIAVPTLLVHGAESRLPLQRLLHLAAVIEGATLVDIEGAGHAVHRENPDALASAVRQFL